MLNFIKAEANRTFTENGAATWASTYSACLDLFATIGALRSVEDQEIIHRFHKAWAENPDIAMKILFFGRDVRGGLGERRVFRVCMDWLARNEPDTVRRNLPHIAEFGRWDDVLVFLDTPCERDALVLIREQFHADMEAMAENREISLLGKWLPSVNASNAETVRNAKRIARFLGMEDAAYRRALSVLRSRIRILENYLREQDYSFSYAAQPSRAMYKYRKAFIRNDPGRYFEFLDRVSHGQAVLHTGTVTPYDIIAPVVTSRRDIPEQERKAMDVTWNAQEDFSGDENALVVVDGSGSMYWGQNPLPAAVAMSLAIYFAERNTGSFRNHFITFSERPQLVEIHGRDIVEKVRYCMGFNEVANTNLQRVFELILNAALRNQVPQSEMPSTLYIISDMEFDSCTRDAGLTNFAYAQKLFADHGYQLPRVVFWNVSSRNEQQPVTMNQVGVALVSGASPRIFDMLSSGILSPMGYMMDILGRPRYAPIAA